MTNHAAVAITAIITLSAVGVIFFIHWLVTRVNWMTRAAGELNERVSELEKCKRPGL